MDAKTHGPRGCIGDGCQRCAGCGPECNGTWPHRPDEPARPFHVRGCPNDDHPAPLRVEAIREVVFFGIKLTPTQANALYNEVYAMLRDRGIVSARDRQPDFMPTLCSIYDALYNAGVDGSR